MASSKASRKSSGGAIYLNGNIYTVASSDWDTQPKNAMVVQDGLIMYVGSDEEARSFYTSGRKYLLLSTIDQMHIGAWHSNTVSISFDAITTKVFNELSFNFFKSSLYSNAIFMTRHKY